MHEVTLCRNILDIIHRTIKQDDRVCIKKIGLEVGRLSCVEREALLFSFEVVAKGSAAEHAMLEIIDIEGKAFCNTCKTTITIERYYDSCQTCGNVSCTIIQGTELTLKYLEVE